MNKDNGFISHLNPEENYMLTRQQQQEKIAFSHKIPFRQEPEYMIT